MGKGNEKATGRGARVLGHPALLARHVLAAFVSGRTRTDAIASLANCPADRAEVHAVLADLLRAGLVVGGEEAPETFAEPSCVLVMDRWPGPTIGDVPRRIEASGMTDAEAWDEAAEAPKVEAPKVEAPAEGAARGVAPSRRREVEAILAFAPARWVSRRRATALLEALGRALGAIALDPGSPVEARVAWVHGDLLDPDADPVEGIGVAIEWGWRFDRIEDPGRLERSTAWARALAPGAGRAGAMGEVEGAILRRALGGRPHRAIEFLDPAASDAPRTPRRLWWDGDGVVEGWLDGPPAADRVGAAVEARAPGGTPLGAAPRERVDLTAIAHGPLEPSDVTLLDARLGEDLGWKEHEARWRRPDWRGPDDARGAVREVCFDAWEARLRGGAPTWWRIAHEVGIEGEVGACAVRLDLVGGGAPDAGLDEGAPPDGPLRTLLAARAFLGVDQDALLAGLLGTLGRAEALRMLARGATRVDVTLAVGPGARGRLGDANALVGAALAEADVAKASRWVASRDRERPDRRRGWLMRAMLEHFGQRERDEGRPDERAIDEAIESIAYDARHGASSEGIEVALSAFARHDGRVAFVAGPDDLHPGDPGAPMPTTMLGVALRAFARAIVPDQANGDGVAEFRPSLRGAPLLDAVGRACPGGATLVLDADKVVGEWAEGDAAGAAGAVALGGAMKAMRARPRPPRPHRPRGGSDAGLEDFAAFFSGIGVAALETGSGRALPELGAIARAMAAGARAGTARAFVGLPRPRSPFTVTFRGIDDPEVGLEATREAAARGRCLILREEEGSPRADGTGILRVVVVRLADLDLELRYERGKVAPRTTLAALAARGTAGLEAGAPPRGGARVGEATIEVVGGPEGAMAMISAFRALATLSVVGDEKILIDPSHAGSWPRMRLGRRGWNATRRLVGARRVVGEHLLATWMPSSVGREASTTGDGLAVGVPRRSSAVLRAADKAGAVGLLRAVLERTGAHAGVGEAMEAIAGERVGGSGTTGVAE